MQLLFNSLLFISAYFRCMLAGFMRWLPIEYVIYSVFFLLYFALKHICIISCSMNFMVFFSSSVENNAAVPELYSSCASQLFPLIQKIILKCLSSFDSLFQFTLHQRIYVFLKSILCSSPLSVLTQERSNVELSLQAVKSPASSVSPKRSPAGQVTRR